MQELPRKASDEGVRVRNSAWRANGSNSKEKASVRSQSLDERMI